MKVKFKDGTIKNCTAPVEQKAFKNSESVGWIMVFALIGEITSEEVDTVITADNISDLTFIPEPLGDEGKVIAVSEDKYVRLSGYDKITMSAIRYAEDTAKTRVEIQLSKGV